MVCFPNAKINLGLFITGKRPDGYHDLESVFMPVDVHDVLEIVPNNYDIFRLYPSGISVAGNPENNLVFKAWRLIREIKNLSGVDCYLHKIIPSGAGLGGGSADGSFMINLLDNTFNLNLSAKEKHQIAEKLGSDCPFFLRNKPALVTGRGEHHSSIELSLSGKFVLLIKPEIHISTADAFSKISASPSLMDWQGFTRLSPSVWKSILRNDFEPGVFDKYPILEQIKRNHYDHGALYAQMSGTGSCVYGIYDHAPELMDFDDSVWQRFISIQ